ncbi:helix-turn-helix domain-containing protein [Thalassobius sp. Cn5-15]|uniref:helix-turn-helix domain-containing protein n=1 Tax=Thalassobius sp. Cn5-15 TaxID=2917763 RepID=UPI001EF2F4C0|nr:helix-turn-helix domain-containing protein [Thalassobius sp. Cn5-15]MCG7492456.1 helix-turn-helix domain-containing protein [Thalassobius sp. Cn5-15]
MLYVMNLNDVGAKRQRLGSATISIIYATNKLEMSRATVSIIWLMSVSGGDWNISALSDASGIDRSTIRSSLRSLERGGYVEQGWSLTQKGQLKAWGLFRRFWQNLDVELRLIIREFGKACYQHPVRQFMRVFCDLDRAARKLRHTLAQSAVANVLTYHPKTKGWTISEISTITGFAYQTVHRELNTLKKEGLATSEKKRFFITRKGLFWDFKRFVKVLKELSKSSYVTAIRFAVWKSSYRS